MSDFEMVVRYEINTGSQWVDVTDDVRVTEDQVITRGRPDESSACDPGKLTFKINNRDGRYSPRNPLSPYYGLIGRNTPVRLSVRGAPVHLSVPGVTGARLRATSPPTITGDLDVRLELALDALPMQAAADQAGVAPYEPLAATLVGRYDTTSSQRAWRLAVATDGRPALSWSPDGTGTAAVIVYATATAPHGPGVRWALRAVLDVNNGGGGHTVTFYTAAALSGPWRQLGQPVTGTGTTSIYAATSALDIGQVQSQDSGLAHPAGDYYRAEIRSGIGGTVVAAPDLTAQAAGATGFTDSAGIAWTVQGDAEVTDWHTRGVWEVTSWPSRWDVSGTDVYVQVEAQGILRRLGQGQKALHSTLRRRVPSYGPLAYWPMEETGDATQAYSPMDGVQPMRAEDIDWESADDLPGSDSLPAVREGTVLHGFVPPPDSAQTSWSAEFVMSIDEAPDTRSTVMRYQATGTVRAWSLQLGPGAEARILGDDEEGAAVVDVTVALGSDITDGSWNRWQFVAEQSGSAVEWVMRWINIGEGSGEFSGSFTGTLGRIRTAQSPSGSYNDALAGMRIGHVAVFSPKNETAYNSADHGFTGESSADRCRRLAQEERQTVATAGLDAETTAMGPQRPDALLDLLQDAADADGGVLAELRALTGLQVRPRVAAYNRVPALELDYAAGEIAPDLEPEDDDQEIRNDVTVQREGGSSARATLDSGALSTQAPPDGVGVYDESVTVNAESDGQLEQIAGWRLHLGTVDELRYPTVTLNLANSRMAAARETWLTHVDVGSRITIANPPPWLPPGPIDLIVQSYTETINQHAWEVELTCTPALPWTVGHVAADDPDDDFAPVHLDTDGSELAAAATATATSLSVAVTDGPLWTTDGADFPFDIRVGGEVMTVTAISGGSSPQTFTVTRSVNGISKAHAAGADVRLADPMIIAL